MSYTKTVWHNDAQPPINSDNLNKIEDGIYQNSLAIEEHEGDISTLQIGLSDAQNRLTTAENAVETLEGNVTSIENAVETLEGNNVFSTTEKVIGTWIDGKPIYRKVLQFTVTEASQGHNHNISNIDKLIKMSTVYNSSTSMAALPYVNAVSDNTQYFYGVYMNRTQVLFRLRNASLPLNMICIVEYTKTTDSVNSLRFGNPNSGGDTPQGFEN